MRLLSANSLHYIRHLLGAIETCRNTLPHCCLLCNRNTANYRDHLCLVCRQDLPYPDQLCLGCGAPIPSAVSFCGKCQQSPPTNILVTASSYHSPSKELISSLKYHGNYLAARELSRHLARRVQQLLQQQLIDKPQFLVPVPLHWRRQHARGFNQAALLAQGLSEFLDIPLLHCCKRIKATTAQAQLSAKQRQHNLDNVFELSCPIKGDCIALIDDVFTTGATMQELSKTILAQQSVEIQYWTIARTLLD
ncbi:MAG: ComF family protein [Psychrobium sp.]|nr:ComF family protein [Psychrobium sp.]